jgi:hypothetical protein
MKGAVGRQSMDGIASVEGRMNQLNRLPVASAPSGATGKCRLL